MLWDDAAHLTKPVLRSLTGLYYIWFVPGATQQYYPLLHSAFWLEWQIWRDHTFAYHVVNVLQHAAAACLLWGVLRHLQVPGAFLAASLFLVHPVNVESVAWITEQKNTLSAVFYFAAAWCYLIFAESEPRKRTLPWGAVTSRSPGWYGLALGLFVLGLLTKTVIATLPAALLLVFWWRRGSLNVKGDVLPLLPWFALGAAAGAVSAWSERVLIGAQGAEFELGFSHRLVLAGRVIWFYLSKQLWPADLMFFYPRWDIDPADWHWWLYLVGVVLVLAVLTAVAMLVRVRAPLAAFLFFAGTLFPALGFFNVFPFRFSFVADHFQYLAGVGIVTLAAAGAMRLAQRASRWRIPIVAVSAACVVLLGVLAWRQSDHYGHDAIHHYRTIIKQNPDAWVAYGNLAWLLVERQEYSEAIALFHRALELNPRHLESLRDLGTTLQQQGRLEEALPYFERALALDPDPKAAENRYGSALLRSGRAAEAVPHLQRAIELSVEEKAPVPRFHVDLGLGLAAVKRDQEAAVEFERAQRLAGDHYPIATSLLADTLMRLGRDDEALPHLRSIVESEPSDAIHRFDLGRILYNRSQFAEAVPPLEGAIKLRPDLLDAYIVLALSQAELQRPVEARNTAVKALEIARLELPAETVRAIEGRLASVLGPAR